MDPDHDHHEHDHDHDHHDHDHHDHDHHDHDHHDHDHHDHDHHDHDHHDHDHHDHGHHGHANDRGLRGALHYVRMLPRMWHSAINDAVVALVDPQPGERVVDIGAGMGAGAMAAGRTGATVIAVEPTPFMRRALVVRRAFARGRRNVRIVDGAAERLPVDDSTVDAIWAVNTMHHWVDVERGVSEIARALCPGGRVVLVDEDFDDPSHPDHDRSGRDDGKHRGFTMVEADRMADLFRSAGLVDVGVIDRRIVGRPVIGVSGTGPQRQT